MSGHAETIRRALPERNGWEDEFTHDAHEALDALLAENQRLREEVLRWQAEYDSVIHGAARLRESLEQIEKTAGHDDSEPQRCALCIAREALAGDTE